MQEGFKDTAYVPVPGDVPTIGFGTTAGVKMGDKISAPKALERELTDISKFESAIKKCVTAPLYQREYDAYVALEYNVGESAFCHSSIPGKLAAGNYQAACETILDFDCGPAPSYKAAKPGEHCYRSDGKPRMAIKGLTNRRQSEYRMCIGVQT